MLSHYLLEKLLANLSLIFALECLKKYCKQFVTAASNVSFLLVIQNAFCSLEYSSNLDLIVPMNQLCNIASLDSKTQFAQM